jgi:transaldolase
MENQYAGPLHESVMTTVTDLWNDSCSIGELEDAIRHGAVGATTNPVIVVDVLKKEMPLWEGRIREIIASMPEGSEEDITWQLIKEMAVKGAELLMPVFEREHGRKGRISIQTNAKYYRNWRLMLKQAIGFNGLAPNMQVKMPVTEAGVKAIEEATFAGVNINATVSFTLPQAIAVAEAVERGLNRRDAQGLPTKDMTPVCTLMIGRLDDWLKVVAKKEGISIDPSFMDWAGIAVLKKAYRIYKERGYRTRLLSAAFRHAGHWSETIGGDIVMTIPHAWQQKFNASGIEPASRMDNPVDPAVIEALSGHFTDFRRAYAEDGMIPQEFDTYGATARTLRSFIASYDSLLLIIRDFMLPDPDKVQD